MVVKIVKRRKVQSGLQYQEQKKQGETIEMCYVRVRGESLLA